MIIAEYFSFLTFGKYAFYVWSSYIIFFATVFWLFYRTKKIHERIFNQLRIKYEREDN